MVSKGLFLAFLLYLVGNIWRVEAQNGTTAPSPTQDSCNGAYLSYQASSPTKTYPYITNPAKQAYVFKSTATLLNTGDEEIKAWQLFIGFQHGEILVSANGVTLEDGSILPAPVGNGTVLMGFPQTDLKTAIETAGDMTQIQVKIDMIGTEFGVGPKSFPMPKNISLINDGYKCGRPVVKKSLMEVCCEKDPKFVPETTAESKFLPRQKGDLTIGYDVIQAYGNNYWAQVNISNDNPIGRLDNWNLTWEWQRNEFIYAMKGAQALEQGLDDCLYGAAGGYYQDFDFSPISSCQKTPTIIDLPPDMVNDKNVGRIPFCCRNGTILPSIMDPAKSKSVFQLQVFKIPPDLNRTTLYPPLNWKIKGVLNPNYKCGQPRRVSPAQFPDPSGTQRMTSAIASWQIVCNITRPANKPAQCCVSFSAFYNESVIPCNTCACGCPSLIKPTCSRDANAMLLPADALLIPFNNRTAKAVAWAGLKHFPIPRPPPCGDYCGVSINWHIYSDFLNGWSARITLFNWGDYTFADWFTAIEMDQAFPGYENVYSFNGTKIPGLKNTIFMEGKLGLNYLLSESDGSNPSRDPRVPGKQQSMISFTKKTTPGINIVAGDGFPKKVIFNGEECALPHIFPSGAGHLVARSIPSLLLAFVFLALFVHFW